MTQATDAILKAIMDQGSAIGRLEGRVGEAIHSVNNVNQKVDAIVEKVAANANLPAKVADIDVRVKALEASENKRSGAVGLGGVLLRLAPVGAISAAIGAAMTFLTGKHP